MTAEPQFTMSTCHRHFFKGHRWWCRGCDRETEREFRDVCEAWWLVPRPIQDYAMDSARLAREPEVMQR